MINGIDEAYSSSKYTEPKNHSRILTLELPDVEDIARAIWLRQHSALDSNANGRRWRDKGVPSKFWDEFVLDAGAVLALLHEKHIKYQKKRAKHQSYTPICDAHELPVAEKSDSFSDNTRVDSDRP
jgi:hypothetical protein